MGELQHAVVDESFPFDARSEQNGSRHDVDFDDLFRRYGPRLRAIAFRRIGDRHLAEDAVQETLLKAYRYRSSWDSSRPVWPWLCTIALNACSDLVRSNKRGSDKCLSEVNESENEVALTQGDPGEMYAEREILEMALDSLNSRHRRILLLSSDGWNYRDIANFEGISFFALQSALQRARNRFRDVYAQLAEENGISPALLGKFAKKGVSSLLFLPNAISDSFKRFRQRMRTAGEQVAHHINNASSFMSYTASSIGALLDSMVGAVAVTAMVVGGAVAPNATARNTLPSSMPATAGQVSTPNSTKNPAPPARQLDVPYAEAQAQAALNALNPYAEKTPEDTHFRSIAASPNYEDDHTVFASGTCNLHSTCNALWVSHDGGASWDRLPARNFLGGPGKLLLSPNWADDGRIYSFDWKGIQLSIDGGDSWLPRLVLPWGINMAALSPYYGPDDRRLVLSAIGGLWDYWPESGFIKAAELDLPAGQGFSLVAASPTYERNISVYLSNGVELRQCGAQTCTLIATSERFREVSRTFVSPSFSRDDFLFGLDQNGRALASPDRGETFITAEGLSKDPNGYQRYVLQIMLLGSESGAPTALASVGTLDYENIYRSVDGGVSWSPIRIDLPGFSVGAEDMGSTPTGRVFAAARRNGIACSEDGGLTWGPRCTPE